MPNLDISRGDALEKVRDILVNQLGTDRGLITEGSSFQEDLNADSLDLVELIMGIEDSFGIKISDENSKRLTTVGEALDYLLEDKLPEEQESVETATEEVPTKAS